MHQSLVRGYHLTETQDIWLTLAHSYRNYISNRYYQTTESIRGHDHWSGLLFLLFVPNELCFRSDNFVENDEARAWMEECMKNLSSSGIRDH